MKNHAEGSAFHLPNLGMKLEKIAELVEELRGLDYLYKMFDSRCSVKVSSNLNIFCRFTFIVLT